MDPVLRARGALLAAASCGGAVLFWRGSYDVFNTVKATWVLLCVVALVLLALNGALRRGSLAVPAPVVWVPLALFTAGLVVGVIAGGSPVRGLIGSPGRHTGLVMYAAYGLLFVTALRVFRDASPDGLVVALVASAVPVAGYALLQAGGLDPLDWQTVEGGPPVFSTLGNIDFASGWLGIVLPLCAWVGLTGSRPAMVRVAGTATAAAVAWATVLTGSLQGVVAGAAALSLVLGVWWWSTAPRRWRVAGVGVGLAAWVAAVGLVATGVGPGSGVHDSVARSLQTRWGKWQTAAAMIADRPLTGFGLDAFGDWYHAYRPQWVALDAGLRRTTDSVHNVALDLLASGGLLLGAGYLAVVGLTAWALAAGLWRTDGAERLRLAAVGGAWLAYQLQTGVSIDVPPLAALGWTLAGTVVAMGLRPAWSAHRLPAPVARAPLVAGAGALVMALALLPVLTRPLRADLAAARALDLEQTGQVEQAAAALDRAVALGSWEARYATFRGGFLNRRGDAVGALAAYREAVRRDPRGLASVITVGRFAAELDRPDLADAAYARALRIDPKTPQVLVEVARHQRSRARPSRAAALLEQVVAVQPHRARWWVELGRAWAAADDQTAARKAFERALALDPGRADARRGLERLGAPAAGG